MQFFSPSLSIPYKMQFSLTFLHIKEAMSANLSRFFKLSKKKKKITFKPLD